MDSSSSITKICGFMVALWSWLGFSPGVGAQSTLGSRADAPESRSVRQNSRFFERMSDAQHQALGRRAGCNQKSLFVAGNSGIHGAGFDGNQAERKHHHVRFFAADGTQGQLGFGAGNEPQAVTTVMLEGGHGSRAGISAQPGQALGWRNVLRYAFFLKRQRRAARAICFAVSSL